MATSPQVRSTVELLLDQCSDLELKVKLISANTTSLELLGPAGERLTVSLQCRRYSMLEQLVRGLCFDFKALPLLALGESKEVRLLTPKIALAKLIASVYSFTNNRYGLAPGTELVRARFSAEIFRTMARVPTSKHLSTAFVGLIESAEGPLLAEQMVCPGNIEVRVKRYHIGSPLHRYLFVDRHETAHGGPPLERWSRFDKPVVCFDWRHPMQDESGRRLADEPLPDDYAAQWLDHPARAKELARQTFEWMEALFESKGMKLIDICYFIDRSGTVLFGEISPDCMRVRSQASDDAPALDKDEWRSGGEPSTVAQRYQDLYDILFEESLAQHLAA